MDITTPFDRRLDHVPHDWRGPIVDVVDTFETVQLGLKTIGIDDPSVLIEAVKLVLDRHDKAASDSEHADALSDWKHRRALADL